jgi:2',3'-cyclic-nucleotide 2'-phosphodiesterase (5'-nucleotidase family)
MVDRVLVTSETELTVGKPGRDLYPTQVAMGNFMTTAILTIAKQKASELKKPIPDISIFTWGGIRKSLPKGEITLRNVFELMPFENEMVVLKLSGQQLKIALTQISKNYNPVNGATMTHDDDDSILVNGKAVQDNQSYHVVVSDYHAYGGDNMSILLEAEDSYFSGIKIRDAIVLYLQLLTSANETLKPDYEPRIKKN